MTRMQICSNRWLVLLLLFLVCSCNTKKHIVEQGHSFNAYGTESDSVVRIDISKINALSDIRDYFERTLSSGNITIYDTSHAVDTGGGYYAPIFAEMKFERYSDTAEHIEKRDTSQTFINVKDSVSVKDLDIVSEDLSREEVKESKDRILPSVRWISILFIVLLVLIVWKKLKKER